MCPQASTLHSHYSYTQPFEGNSTPYRSRTWSLDMAPTKITEYQEVISEPSICTSVVIDRTPYYVQIALLTIERQSSRSREWLFFTPPLASSLIFIPSNQSSYKYSNYVRILAARRRYFLPTSGTSKMALESAVYSIFIRAYSDVIVVVHWSGA